MTPDVDHKSSEPALTLSLSGALSGEVSDIYSDSLASRIKERGLRPTDYEREKREFEAGLKALEKEDALTKALMHELSRIGVSLCLGTPWNARPFQRDGFDMETQLVLGPGGFGWRETSIGFRGEFADSFSAQPLNYKTYLFYPTIDAVRRKLINFAERFLNSDDPYDLSSSSMSR